jgi:hypothetical protein
MTGPIAEMRRAEEAKRKAGDESRSSPYPHARD